MNSLLITQNLTPIQDTRPLQVHYLQIQQVLSIIKPMSFDLIQNSEDCQLEALKEKSFWKDIFSTLKENGRVKLIYSQNSSINESQITSLLKMNGFSSI